MNNQRNYGIDLLRMLAMFMIVVMHILGIGGIMSSCDTMSSQYEAAWFLEAVAYCAVNCYALISGYVGIDAAYKYSNLILLWLRVVFYTVSITILYGILMPNTVDKITYLKAFFPVMKSPYWYFTAYFGLFFFIPLLNKAINSMTKRQLKAIIMAFISFFSLLQTIFGDKFGTVEGYSALWLIVLYIIGAYIKKYNSLHKITIIRGLTGYVIMIIISWGSKYVVELLATLYGESSSIISLIASYSERLIRYISPTILFASIFLLVVFIQLKIAPGLQRCVAILSPLAFSVYIIHAHPLVWNNFMDCRFSSYGSLSTPIMVIFILGTALIIYFICSFIDMVRVCIFNALKLKERIENIEKQYLGNLWNEP